MWKSNDNRINKIEEKLKYVGKGLLLLVSMLLLVVSPGKMYLMIIYIL